MQNSLSMCKLHMYLKNSNTIYNDGLLYTNPTYVTKVDMFADSYR